MQELHPERVETFASDLCQWLILNRYYLLRRRETVNPSRSPAKKPFERFISRIMDSEVTGTSTRSCDQHATHIATHCKRFRVLSALASGNIY